MSFAVIAAAVAAVAAVASAAVGAAQASATADYQSKIAENNAKLAEYNRNSELEQGNEKAKLSMMRTAFLKSKQIAAAAQSGIDVGSDSVLDVVAGTELVGQQDVAQIQLDAAQRAWGYENQAAQFKSDASWAQTEGNLAVAANSVKAVGAAAGGVANIYKELG